MKRFIRYLTSRHLAIWLIVAPVALSAVYLYVLAADRYVSESAITVKQSGDQTIGMAGGLSGLASIFQVTGVNARSDLTLLQTYITSLDMLEILEAKLHLREAFSAPRKDVLLRMSADANQEDFLDYYRARVEVRFDDTSGLLVLRTQGFTPEQAQAINKTIIEASESYINRISQRLAQEQTGFASSELAKAISKYRTAKDKLFAFQERNKVLDPTAQAAANAELTNQLQGRLTLLEADLRTLSSYMADNSYQVRSLRDQIEAAREQMAAEATRGTKGTTSSQRLNSLAADFKELQIEVDFAEQAYKAAAISMETARLESTRKIKTLIMVASPAKPEKATYPRRAYDLVSLLLGFFMLFSIARLLIATIEDHID